MCAQLTRKAEGVARHCRADLYVRFLDAAVPGVVYRCARKQGDRSIKGCIVYQSQGVNAAVYEKNAGRGRV